MELEARDGAEKEAHRKAIELPVQQRGDDVGVRARHGEEREHRGRGQDRQQRGPEPLGGEDLAREAPLEDVPRIVAVSRPQGGARRGGR